ncbi:sigma-70 family RNA polymerase sigma factor [Isosphaeraceae bacterium EP7]
MAGLGDGELLDRYERRSQALDAESNAAFAALVARHGPLVRRLCRRLLDDPNDAEDAFQATFLVLARRPQAIRDPSRLPSWLYGTACRVASKQRLQAARRRKHETAAARDEAFDGPLPDPICESARVLVEEVGRLPGRIRAALLLCELDGLNQDEAARRLGCSDRTLRRRLVRAKAILKSRLIRRGMMPSVLTLGKALNLEATAHAGPTSWAGLSAGSVSATTTALAETILRGMLWSRLAALILVGGLTTTLGIGAIAASGAFGQRQVNGSVGQNADEKAPDAGNSSLSATEQFQALMKRFDDATASRQKAVDATPEKADEIYRNVGPFLGEYGPALVDLAKRHPGDTAAIDSLIWVVEKSLWGGERDAEPFDSSVTQAMQILVRDYPSEPRLGPLALGMVNIVSPRRDSFLSDLSGRSPNRTVKGQATLARAQYLQMQAYFAQGLQRGDETIPFFNLHEKFQIDGDTLRPLTIPTGATRSSGEMVDLRKVNSPESVKSVRLLNPGKLGGEAAVLFDRVLSDFADVPYLRFDAKYTRETLGDVVRILNMPGLDPVASLRITEDSETYNVGFQKALELLNADGVGEEERWKTYLAATPRWADYGPRMWRIAEDAPRTSAAFNALIWILGHQFLDANPGRAVLLGKVVDRLIRDHLEDIGNHLESRDVARAFNSSMPTPAPHVDRLYRALAERGKTREIRGRMSLLLGSFYKAEADLVELEAESKFIEWFQEPARYDPAYLAGLVKTGRQALARRAEDVLLRVKADYGDLLTIGRFVRSQTFAEAVSRDIDELRAPAIGQQAHEIRGEDFSGKEMTLSEYRGNVVLLDLEDFSLEGKPPQFARDRETLRSIVERFRDRPFVVLGAYSVSNEEIKVAEDKGWMTWRAWMDGESVEPGPITRQWHIYGYPNFVMIDHEGVVRHKALNNPFDAEFDPELERMVKAAEEAAKAKK